MDTIREWLSDNLRYILLGIAMILVLTLIVLGVKLISGISGGSKNKTEAVTEAQTESVTEEAVPAAEPTAILTENDSKVLSTMTAYYTARTNKDYETLKALDPAFDSESEQATLDYVENYSNIRTFSVDGPIDGSCIAYVCYDGKVKDIDTLVPSLTQFYLKTGSDGLYYIADTTGDNAAEQFIEQMRASDEVQKLIAEVSAECKKAEASDPVLRDFMESHSSKASSDEEETETETEKKEEKMYVIDTCNVRAEPNTDCEILGQCYYGEEVTVTGEEEDNWYEVDFGDGEAAYIKGDFLMSQEEFEQQQAANYFAPGYSDSSYYYYDSTYDSYYDPTYTA